MSMYKDKLTIVDIENYSNIKINNSNILFLNKGKIDYKNSKIIELDINKQKIFKKKFLYDFENFFHDLKKQFEKKLNHINPQELELFNLRNDKINYFEKLCLILYLEKFHKKFKSVELIIDDQKYLKVYTSVLKKFDLRLIKKQKKHISISIKFQFFKFLFKSIYFIILSKIIFSSQKFNKNNKILNLSIYPYLYNKKKKIDLYNCSKDLKLNFSLTDETHLNLNFNKYLGHIINLKKIENIIPVENYINFKDYFLLIKKFNIDHSILSRYLKKKSIKFKNIEMKYLIVEHLWISFLNRYKLSIYENALRRVFTKQKVEKFNYFLFEYSFGFFLSRVIKKNYPKLKTIGFQHGIFSKYLLWLNILRNDDEKNIYLPDKIVCNQKQSYQAYKKYASKVQLISKKNINEKFPKIYNKSENILVFPGQHDLFDCYNFFIKNKKFSNKKIFIKLHPNNKKEIISERNNIKIVNRIDYKLSYRIYMSPTTTMIYMFKNLNKKFNLIKFNYKFNLQ